MVSCLLEGAIHLGPGSVLQHCHLRVRPASMGRGGLRVASVLRVGGWSVCLSTQDASPLPHQGPIHIGAGCFVSGLDIAQSKALRGLELRDLVLQGHHVRLPGSLGCAFTLIGRLDSWEVGTCLISPHPHLQALGAP